MGQHGEFQRLFLAFTIDDFNAFILIPPPQQPRPTPAHLTSAQAEQILAQACENESLNAKRMRIGMEPIGQNYFQSSTSSPSPSLHQNITNNSAIDLNGSAASFNSPSKLENGFSSSTPQKMSMSPVYAPSDTTRTNNNNSPFEFNGQAAAGSSVASCAVNATATGKTFPTYFNNHMSNGKTIFSLYKKFPKMY